MEMNKLLPFILPCLLVGLAGCNSNQISNSEIFKDSEISELVSYSETRFPSYNANFSPPVETKAFELSQDYPKSHTTETYPWETLDFKKAPNEYMEAVLKYCLEGNVEVDFRGQENKTRKWYHAPWLHDDGRYSNTGKYIGNGREYYHGLTRERGTPKFEIHNQQDVELENWAVGMYNEPGGYILGKVWSSPLEKPYPNEANFPEGTVSFKLLFTDGTIDKVPFLEGSLEWDAHIYSCSPSSSSCTDKNRILRKVKLLQIDVAIKDNRAEKTGWVFGTFIYDASKNGNNVWDKMVPVGLSWGDDPEVTKDLNTDGAFVNDELTESYINASLLEKSNYQYTNEAYIKYHGLGGRLNGPVDNPISSCISCHGQAGVNSSGSPLPLGDFTRTTNRSNYSLASFNLFFTNVAPGSFNRIFNGTNYTTTDYSLQISAGIRNYHNNERLKDNIVEFATKSNREIKNLTEKDVTEVVKYVKSLPEVNRGEQEPE